MPRMVTNRFSLLIPACLALLAGVPASGAEVASFSDIPRSPSPASPLLDSNCSAASAHSLIGQPYNEDTRRAALARSGAASTRQVQLGAPKDLSLQAWRLTIEVDGQGVISHLSCE